MSHGEREGTGPDWASEGMGTKECGILPSAPTSPRPPPLPLPALLAPGSGGSLQKLRLTNLSQPPATKSQLVLEEGTGAQTHLLAQVKGHLLTPNVKSSQGPFHLQRVRPGLACDISPCFVFLAWTMLGPSSLESNQLLRGAKKDRRARSGSLRLPPMKGTARGE